MKVAKQTEEIAELALPQAAAQFKATRDQFGQQGDVNLGTGLLSDIDTAKGGELHTAAVAQTLGSTTFNQSVMADAIIQSDGGNIKDQLEGLDTDGEGRLIVGAGDAGVEDEATFFLTLSAMRLASAKGVLTSDVFRQVGLGYAGVNMESFLQSLAAIAKEKDVPASQILQAGLGSGFLETIARESAAARLTSEGE